MKNLLILSVFLYSQLSFAQHVTKLELLSFVSSDRISKDVSVFLYQDADQSSIIIQAANQKSSQQQSCSWESRLDFLKLPVFISDIENAIEKCHEKNKPSWLNNRYKIECKRNGKMQISFLESRCNREHKVTYFQKNCNRLFSFILTDDIAKILKERVAFCIDNSEIEISELVQY